MKNKGFTLLEMLVSLAIFGIITAIVVFNYGAFNSNILVTNLAYEIALAVRSAQTYGLSVKNLDSSSSADYAYGVHFSSSDYRFYIFADLSKDGRFDDVGNCSDPDNECLEEVKLRGDASLTNIVTCSSANSSSCSSADYVDVFFLRPNPQAIIMRDGEYRGTTNNFRMYDKPPQLDQYKAIIELTGQRGQKKKNIIIERTGQISVQD